MAVSQISVFLENKPGHLLHILNIFETSEINVRGFSMSDTGDYGIVRFVLDKPKMALDVLRANSCAATESDVLCIRLPDRLGELAKVIRIFAAADINVIYSYTLVSNIIAIHTNNPAVAEASLKESLIDVVSQDEISAGA
ncbi:MAG: amino acid-binding protein [Betaproteobacteria bacterium]|nr:amino acid-binding protein [Betaproteobacteria bacterium]